MTENNIGNLELKVILEEWTESELGWGTRPDGASLHKNIESYKIFVKEYWDGMPKEVPNEYSRPNNSPIEVYVDKETFDKVQKSKNGIWILQGSYYELKKNWRRAL